MMLSGELDAVLFYLRRSQPDRSQQRGPRIATRHQTAVPRSAAEGVRFYRKTGIYPINHGMVIKRELAERHPWVILNILKAFHRANELAERQRIEHAEYHIEAGLLPAEAQRRCAHRSFATAWSPTGMCSKRWRNIRSSRG